MILLKNALFAAFLQLCLTWNEHETNGPFLYRIYTPCDVVNYALIKGQPATFECHLWLDTGQTRTSYTAIKLQRNGTKLKIKPSGGNNVTYEIKNVTQSDDLTYECHYGIFFRGKIYLRRKRCRPPYHFWPILEINITYENRGKQAELKCVAIDSNPIMKNKTIKWFHKGTQLPYDGYYSLRIDPLTPERNGTYECSGSNPFGVGHAKATVNTSQFHVAPAISFKTTDDRYSYDVGERVTLHCQMYKAKPAKVTFTFLFNNNEMNRRPPEMKGDYIATKTIRYFKKETAGEYTCKARNAAGTAYKTLELHLAGLPEVNVTSASVNEGEEATLKCTHTSHPKAFLFGWYKDGKKIVTSYHDKNNLVIQNVRRTAHGEYECRVENKLGWTRKTALLQVLYKPEISMEDANTLQGGNVTLYCKVSAFPSVKYVTWYKNAKKIRENADKNYTIFDVHSWDAGTYKCQATNNHGTATQTASLFVVPLNFKTFPNDMKSEEGDDILLNCSLQSNEDLDRVRMKWLFNKEVISQHLNIVGNVFANYRLEAKTFRKTGIYNLRITSVRVENDGEYTCQANNEEVSARLTILKEPSPPRIVINSPRSARKVGDPLNANCSSRGGIPAPTFMWFINNDRIVNSDSYQIGEVVKPTRKGAKLINSLNIVLSHRHHLANLECLVENHVSKGKRLAASYRIAVQFAPVVTLTAPRFTRVGKEIRITCKFEANPKGDMKAWYKDNVILTTHTQPLLVIHDATVSHTGVYMCIVRNKLGLSNATAFLTVFGTKSKDDGEEKPKAAATQVKWFVIGIPVGIVVVIVVCCCSYMAYQNLVLKQQALLKTVSAIGSNASHTGLAGYSGSQSHLSPHFPTDVRLEEDPYFDTLYDDPYSLLESTPSSETRSLSSRSEDRSRGRSKRSKKRRKKHSKSKKHSRH